MIYIDQNMLLGHIKSNPSKENIKKIILRKYEFGSILFHKNSPLLPMFNQGIQYLKEGGLERQLYYKWIVQSQDNDTSERNTLTLGQIMLAFAIMVVVFIVSLVVLCGEVSFKQFNTRIMLPGRKKE